MCDDLASSVWALPPDHAFKPADTAPQLPALTTRVYAHGNTTTGLVVKKLPIILHGIKFEEHLRDIWPDAPLEDINWRPIGTIVKSLSLSQQSLWMKAAYNQWCTTKAQGRHSGSDHFTCPLCQLTDEDDDHVLCCPHKGMCAHRQKRWAKLQSLLVTLQTPPNLIQEIKLSLFAWLQDVYEGLDEFLPDEMCAIHEIASPAVKAQEAIGCSMAWRYDPLYTPCQLQNGSACPSLTASAAARSVHRWAR